MGAMFYKDSAGNVIPMAYANFSPRVSTTFTSPSLDDQAVWDTQITLKQGYKLLHIVTNIPARVRVYDSIASRTADVDRAVGVDPQGAHGVILDFLTTLEDLSWWMNPVVDGYTVDGTENVPVAVTNMSGSTGEVTTTLTWSRSE